MPHNWYFTFGSNHVDARGQSLGRCYVRITIEQPQDDDYGLSEARERMFEQRLDKWSMQYSEEQKPDAIDKWALTERSLESVRIIEAMRKQIIADKIEPHRVKLQTQLDALAAIGALMEKLPDGLLDKATIYEGGLDIDSPDREQSLAAMASLNAGRWEKTTNGCTSTAIDYTANVGGVRVRLWGAEAPETCRIVEEEIVIPEQRYTRKKLVCSEAAQTVT